jgi:hypothetical protein
MNDRAKSFLFGFCALITLCLSVNPIAAQVNDEAGQSDRLQYLDIFEFEVADDPRVAPDGSRVVYVRRGFDIMTDGGRSALWIVSADGSDHRALTDGLSSVSSPRRVRVLRGWDIAGVRPLDGYGAGH